MVDRAQVREAMMVDSSTKVMMTSTARLATASRDGTFLSSEIYDHIYEPHKLFMKIQTVSVGSKQLMF